MIVEAEHADPTLHQPFGYLRLGVEIKGLKAKMTMRVCTEFGPQGLNRLHHAARIVGAAQAGFP